MEFSEYRNGGWIQTYSGKKFYPLDPRTEDICIEDIAHALSLTCRYNGHCKLFYSVAQHSLHMSIYCKGDPKWLLMHDAAEAYISDVPRPIKPMLTEFKEIESRILQMIGYTFNLEEMNDFDIHHADMVMLATEKRDVLNGKVEWGIELPEPLPDKIWPHDSQIIEKLFIKRAKELEIIL